jgi:hypothetical protein
MRPSSRPNVNSKACSTESPFPAFSMDRGDIAEKVLSLALEPARSAAAIGDLVELSISRGRVWFWVNVFQTLLAAVGHAAKRRPLFILGLASRAAFELGGLLLLGVLTRIALHQMLFLHSNSSYATDWTEIPALQLVASLSVGRSIARRSQNNDLAVCIAMMIFGPLLVYPLRVLLLKVGLIDLSSTFRLVGALNSSSWWPFTFCFACCLAGTIWERRQRPMANLR